MDGNAAFVDELLPEVSHLPRGGVLSHDDLYGGISDVVPASACLPDQTSQEVRVGAKVGQRGFRVGFLDSPSCAGELVPGLGHLDFQRVQQGFVIDHGHRGSIHWNSVDGTAEIDGLSTSCGEILADVTSPFLDVLNRILDHKGGQRLVTYLSEVGGVVGLDCREHLRVNLATGFGGDPLDLSVRVFLIPQLDGFLVSGGPPPKSQRNLRVRGVAARTAAGCTCGSATCC